MPSNVKFTVAGTEFTIDQAVDRFSVYPRNTPAKFDYPPRGEYGTISLADIKRTRSVSSRISHVEGDYFIAYAADAPWVPMDADLADADPGVHGGLFNGMSDLYRYFFGNAPSGIHVAKVHKVLHLKYPALFPLLDSRVSKAYKTAGQTHKNQFPDLWRSELQWIAVREDLLVARSSGAIEEMREAMARFENSDSKVQKHVRDMAQLTDLRLLDVLVW